MISHGNISCENIQWFDNNLSIPVINREVQKNIKDYADKKCNISIVCSRFNKVENNYARMIKYNQKGMDFESGQHYPKGTNIFFRIKNCALEGDESKFCEGLRTASLAEVVKCEKIEDQDNLFRTNVKYYEHY